MQYINSIKDEKVVLARELKNYRERQKYNKFLLEGEEIILWAIENNISINYIITSYKEEAKINPIILHNVQNIFFATEGIIKKITDTSYLVPIIGVGNIRNFPINDDFILVLDEVRDFGNIGTIIRTGQAFGINNFISTDSNFDLFQRKTIEASRGKAFSTNIRYFKNVCDTILYLKKNNYQIITTSPYGTNLQ